MRPKQAAAADLGRQISATPSRVPAVDVLVPSLRRTAGVDRALLASAPALDYRSFRVWLLMTVAGLLYRSCARAWAPLSHPWLPPQPTQGPATSTMLLPQLQGDLIAGGSMRRGASAGISAASA